MTAINQIYDEEKNKLSLESKQTTKKNSFSFEPVGNTAVKRQKIKKCIVN